VFIDGDLDQVGAGGGKDGQSYGKKYQEVELLLVRLHKGVQLPQDLHVYDFSGGFFFFC
jgi:hypothetical protein